MKPKIITITIDTYNDINSLGCVGVDAMVERERELGQPFNRRNYENVRDASFVRLQAAQRKLLERPIPEAR